MFQIFYPIFQRTVNTDWKTNVMLKSALNTGRHAARRGSGSPLSNCFHIICFIFTCSHLLSIVDSVMSRFKHLDTFLFYKLENNRRKEISEFNVCRVMPFINGQNRDYKIYSLFHSFLIKKSWDREEACLPLSLDVTVLIKILSI